MNQRVEVDGVDVGRASALIASKPGLTVKAYAAAMGIPVPPHNRDLIDRLPLATFLGLAKGAAELGLNDAQWRQTLKDAVAYHRQAHRRCTCCFNWTDTKALVLALVGGGRIILGTACRQCERKIERGRVTLTMNRNVASFVADALEGVR